MLVSLTPVDEIFIEVSSSASLSEAFILREQLHLIGTEPRISMNYSVNIRVSAKTQIRDRRASRWLTPSPNVRHGPSKRVGPWR